MNLKETREFFAADRFATYKTGITIDEVGEGCAVCSFEITDDDVAAHGSVMGGAIFTLADFTFAVSTNAPGQLTVTVSSTINYIGMPKDKRLVAVSKCLKSGKKACFYEITVSDGAGNLVATVLTNGIRI